LAGTQTFTGNKTYSGTLTASGTVEVHACRHLGRTENLSSGGRLLQELK
jgi:hypothetical protein